MALKLTYENYGRAWEEAYWRIPYEAGIRLGKSRIEVDVEIWVCKSIADDKYVSRDDGQLIDKKTYSFEWGGSIPAGEGDFAPISQAYKLLMIRPEFAGAVEALGTWDAVE
jgi:hypothetical protein